MTINQAPDLDRAAQHCKNLQNPVALAAALLDCGTDAETAVTLAAEHGHNGALLRRCISQMIQNENSSTDCESTELSEAATASTSDAPESNATANDVQDAALGAIHVARDWRVFPVPATAAGLAQWCRENPAPDAKPEGDSNAPNLGFLLTPTNACSGIGHPKLGDVGCTHGCSFDLDKITGDDILETLKRTKDAGHAAVFWESHSSTEAEPKGRLLVIMDPPCPAAEHERVYKQLQAELCPWAPKGQHNTNRGWNPPRAGTDVIELEGRPVDWRRVIASAPTAEPAQVAAATPDRETKNRAGHLKIAAELCDTWPIGDQGGNSSARLKGLAHEIWERTKLPVNDVVSTMLLHYDPRCVDAAGKAFPWGEEEIRRVVEKAAAAQPRAERLLTAEWTESQSSPVPEQRTAQEQERDATQLESLYAQVFRPLAELPAPKPLSYVCEGLLIARDVRPACLVCYPGVGKSTAGVELARAVATGTAAFGQFPCQQGRVLFIANEGGRGAHDALLRQVPPDQHDNVTLVRDTLLLAGAGAEVAFALLEHAAKQFDLIVLDSLNSSLPGLDENDARSAEPLGRLEQLLAADSGARAAMVVLRHTGKTGAGRKDPMQAGRGTSAIDGRVSVQWLLEPIGDLGVDRSVDWQCTRANDTDRGPARPFNVALRGGKFEVSQETGKQVAVKAQAVATQTRKQRDDQLARAAIQEAWWTGGRKGIGVRDAKQIADTKGLPPEAGRRALEQLVADGKNPATRGAQYAYRLSEKGPVLWGVNPMDTN